MVRTVLSRLPDKARSERSELDRLLDDVVLAHVGFTDGAHPVVLPIGFARDGDRLLIHGSTGSRWLRRLADGAAAAVAVTSLEGLVLARSAFESSMQYRSAVLFGRFAPVPPDRRATALDRLTDRLVPGRVGEVRRPTARELAATIVLALPIAEWSLKVSQEWPDDPAADVAGPAWAGVVPMRTVYGPALAAPDLAAGRSMPESVRRLTEG
jgi:nitroimidazol reductase NimA-like FMN-containing flavoprotein (pyridoxamine 5'-phosphate oxidase superfamily)